MTATAFIVAALIVVVLVLMITETRRHKAFNERFPPISDAEFVARCAPGTKPEIAMKVRRMISDSLGVDCDRIYPSSRLIDDLGAD